MLYISMWIVKLQPAVDVIHIWIVKLARRLSAEISVTHVARLIAKVKFEWDEQLEYCLSELTIWRRI